MGYIHSTIEAIDRLGKEYNIKSVVDLGAQNNFTFNYLPAPYVSGWYKEKGIEYMCIDLNGENDAKQWDLGEPLKTNKKFDLVVNAGTLEHVKDLFQGFANMHKLCRVGGIMVHENPRTGNWPGHGYHYFDNAFYRKLAEATGYTLIDIKNTVSAHNYETGNNVMAILLKQKDTFIKREDFPQVFTS